jgi:hypothetical protein
MIAAERLLPPCNSLIADPEMESVLMKWSLILGFAVLVGQPFAVAARPPCAAKLSEKVLEAIVASAVAFHGQVTAVASNVRVVCRFPSGKRVAGTQEVTFRVLNSWKGPYHVGAAVRVTVSDTSICASVGCVSPFNTGDVTLVLSPFPQSELPELSEGFGCWAAYDGVEVKRVLWVPLLSGD